MNCYRNELVSKALGVLALVLSAYYVTAQSVPEATDGLLDARAWNFDESKLGLKGQWNFHYGKLMTQQECNEVKGGKIPYPALWNDLRGSGIGYGTYHLSVIVPDTYSHLALEIPQMYSSFMLYVNDSLVARGGKPGTSAEETISQWSYQTVSFPVNSDTLSIVLQIANFHHYKGGVKDPIKLGAPAKIEHDCMVAIASNLVEVSCLLIGGVTFFILYLAKKKKVILYFSLLCLTWSVRGIFSNLYPVTWFFPDFNWNIMVRIEYLTLYGGVIWSLLFVDLLFGNISKRAVIYLLVTINILFVLFTLFAPPVIFSRWVSIYLTVAALTVCYCGVIIARALFFEQLGAWFLTISLLLGVLVFGYDIIAYGVTGYNVTFLSVGYLLIFGLVTASLLAHLGIIKSKTYAGDILTYDQMFRKDDNNKKKS